MTDEPKDEIARLRALEYAKVRRIHEEHLPECAICGAVHPDYRARWCSAQHPGTPRHPDGPRHFDSCWLGRRIAELEPRPRQLHVELSLDGGRWTGQAFVDPDHDPRTGMTAVGAAAQRALLDALGRWSKGSQS